MSNSFLAPKTASFDVKDVTWAKKLHLANMSQGPKYGNFVKKASFYMNKLNSIFEK